MKLIRVCQKCMDQISSWGEPAIGAYWLICEVFVTTGNPLVIDLSETNAPLIQIVSFLERKGVIYTCETSVEVMARPLGCEIDNDQENGRTWYSFCHEGRLCQ